MKDEYKISHDRVEHLDISPSGRYHANRAKYAYIDIPCEDLSFAFSKETGKLAFIVNYKD